MIPGAPAALAALAVPDGASGRCGCAPLCRDLGPGMCAAAPCVLCSATARGGPARMLEGIDVLWWRGTCSAIVVVAWTVACVTATLDAGARAGALGAGDVAARTPGDEATISSATPTAGGASAGVATTSTTGLGSGVAGVVGAAVAGCAVAVTMGLDVGWGSGFAAAGAALAGEAVATVLDVALGAGVLPAGAGVLFATAGV